MNTREFGGMVEMFYTLIRGEVAQMYPFSKTQTLHKLGIVGPAKIILQYSVQIFSLCTKFEIKTKCSLLSQPRWAGSCVDGRVAPSVKPSEYVTHSKWPEGYPSSSPISENSKQRAGSRSWEWCVLSSLGKACIVRRITCSPQLAGFVMNHDAFTGTKNLWFTLVKVDGNIKGSLPQWGEIKNSLFKYYVSFKKKVSLQLLPTDSFGSNTCQVLYLVQRNPSSEQDSVVCRVQKKTPTSLSCEPWLLLLEGRQWHSPSLNEFPTPNGRSGRGRWGWIVIQCLKRDIMKPADIRMGSWRDF